jgi:MtN3 and saliva related transmembrane protein
MNPELIGGIAAILTTAAYIPQVIKVARYRHTQSLSLGMYILLSCGIAGWLVYGFMIDSPSLIWANIASLAMILFILGMKVKCG